MEKIVIKNNMDKLANNSFEKGIELW